MVWGIVSTTILINYLILFYFFYKSHKRYTNAIKKIDITQDATIFALAHQAELRDKETGEHLIRTAEYVKEMVKEIRKDIKYKDYITDKYIKDITKASPLHDIGKVGISDTILLKSARLTIEEFEEIKKHCWLGTETLLMAKEKLGFETFIDIAVEITYYHHEKWDGSGYPKGLKGEEIPLSARIMAIADVYDALRHYRVYKEPFSHEKTVEIIKADSGTHFDPFLVETFLNISDKFKEISSKYKD